MKHKREDLINRIKDPNRERTWMVVDEFEHDATSPDAPIETAASTILHDKNQPDELLSTLVKARQLMIDEYPKMDANDKIAVRGLLAKLNTLVGNTAERNEEIAG